ncbi:hypothetical protein LXL04_019571 [Taraxacum kok-saghyz]
MKRKGKADLEKLGSVFGYEDGRELGEEWGEEGLERKNRFKEEFTRIRGFGVEEIKEEGKQLNSIFRPNHNFQPKKLDSRTFGARSLPEGCCRWRRADTGGSGGGGGGVELLTGGGSRDVVGGTWMRQTMVCYVTMGIRAKGNKGWNRGIHIKPSVSCAASWNCSRTPKKNLDATEDYTSGLELLLPALKATVSSYQLPASTFQLQVFSFKLQMKDAYVKHCYMDVRLRSLVLFEVIDDCGDAFNNSRPANIYDDDMYIEILVIACNVTIDFKQSINQGYTKNVNFFEHELRPQDVIILN